MSLVYSLQCSHYCLHSQPALQSSPLRSALAAVSIIVRCIGKAESTITINLWFHTCTLGWCFLPLAAAWPQGPVLPTWGEAAMLAGVCLISFASQNLMVRGYQLLPAAQASAITFLQVRGSEGCV
jgi:drug/metabolite transporter (DMT)-like permease